MLDFSPGTALWSLAASAFVSATLLPGSSEVVLVALLAKFPALFWQAILIATLANTLGGMTSLLVGRLLPRKIDHAAMRWLERYGTWALLLSWVPLIGDALCVAAGWLRLNAWHCALVLALGKFARYLVLASGWQWVAGTWLS